MELYVTEIATFVIPLILFVYTLEAFLSFRHKNEDQNKGLYISQVILIFGMQIACFIEIIARTGKAKYLFFFGFQILIFVSIVVLFYIIYPDGNKLIINNACMLLSISMIILTRISYDKAVKQFFIITFSFIVGFFIPAAIFRYNLLKRFTWAYAAIGIAAIGVVLLLGATTNGSKIAYTIAGITFQPSEFVKIVFLFFMAGALYKAESIWELFLASIVAAVHVIILVLSKDLGSALIFFIIYLCKCNCSFTTRTPVHWMNSLINQSLLIHF